jgi:hypothetical protein
MKSGIDSIYKSSGFESHRKDNRKYIWRIYLGVFCYVFYNIRTKLFNLPMRKRREIKVF